MGSLKPVSCQAERERHLGQQTLDLHVEVRSLPSTELLQAAPGESTASIRARCAGARQHAMERQGKSNHALQGREIDQHLQLDDAAVKLLNVAATRLGWSARGTHRVLKLARTIADLAQARGTEVSHLAEAMQYRMALRPGH